MQSLYDISNELREVYNKLENGEGIDLETGEISEEMQNALAISQQNLQTKGIDIGYVIKSFDDQIEMCEREIKRITELKKSMQNKKDWLKDKVKSAMEEFGIVEIDGTPIGKPIKLSFRKSESIEVDNVDLLDDKFKRVKIEADKTAIKQAIKNGEQVEGARLVENNNLQIR